MKRAIVLAVVVAAVAFAAIASANRRGGGARGERRSPIVYPEQRIAIRMDHSHEAHRQLPCVRCHVNATESRRASDLLIPPERACLPCHAEQIDRASASVDRCGTCHAGYGEEGAAVVPASRFPTARIRFSHAEHAREGLTCLECHGDVPLSTIASREHLPTMRSCFRCHGGARPTAPTACATCHATLGDGRLRTAFPEGELLPPAWLHGMEHDRDWIVRHRWVGADQGELCASCHSESDCADCHDGRVRPPRVHPNDWLTVHTTAARRNEPRCTSCHTTQTFCNECHSRLGLSPISAPNVRFRGRYHPPDEVWVRGPALHAREARRSMNACVSCHAEGDCVQCHGALGIGAGINPHPPGFRERCGSARRQNARACIACHGDDIAALCP